MKLITFFILFGLTSYAQFTFYTNLVHEEYIDLAYVREIEEVSDGYIIMGARYKYPDGTSSSEIEVAEFLKIDKKGNLIWNNWLLNNTCKNRLYDFTINDGGIYGAGTSYSEGDSCDLFLFPPH